MLFVYCSLSIFLPWKMWSKDTHTEIATYRLDYQISLLSESFPHHAKKDGSYGCQRRLNKYFYKVIEGGVQLVVFISKHDANPFG